MILVHVMMLFLMFTKPVPTRDNFIGFRQGLFALPGHCDLFFTVTNQTLVSAFDDNFFSILVFAGSRIKV